MSRIHEALKRAEQERIKQPAAASEEKAPQEKAPVASPAADSIAPGISAPMGGLEMNSVFTHQATDRNTERGPDRRGAILEPSLLSDSAPRLRGQQFIRFDDIWQASSVPGWHIDSQISVFTDPGAAPLVAEQFRTLRSRLHQIRDRQPLKSVVVTSAVASEGKTFVSTNLAQSLARQQGCKVLLIDADLRAPGLQSALGAPLAPGLSDYLRGQASDTAIVQRGVADLLCLIPAGNRVNDPLELLSNGRFKVLLDKLAPLFDWVVIDSPPVLPVCDAVVLADYCDGTLCVVRSAFTGLECAQRACHELQAKNLLGVVLNCADEAAAYAQYGSYATTQELAAEVA
jgi:capsular exopolysaccharide synthesis family protein